MMRMPSRLRHWRLRYSGLHLWGAGQEDCCGVLYRGNPLTALRAARARHKSSKLIWHRRTNAD